MADSLKQHVIADSDLHVMEPPDLWQRYIDPAFAHAAPIGLAEIPRDMRVRVKNHTMLRLGRVRPLRVDGRKTGWREEHDSVYADPESRGFLPLPPRPLFGPPLGRPPRRAGGGGGGPPVRRGAGLQGGVPRPRLRE